MWLSPWGTADWRATCPSYASGLQVRNPCLPRRRNGLLPATGSKAATALKNQALRTTLAALSPLGPCWHSNSTASPSFRVLYPFSWIAEKCTKTSSPVERWINPYPLAPLNHFTVPFSLTENSFHCREQLVPRISFIVAPANRN